jgi:glyoxylase-like metal-dependent hydrolase (beta-lactamase superfamily II)
MYQIADDVYLLKSNPPYSTNCYLIRDILIDSGTRIGRKFLLSQLEDIQLSAHMITHVHPDHQGSSKVICEKYQIPLWCSKTETLAMESADFSQTLPRNPLSWLIGLVHSGSGHPVSHQLEEGDAVGDFTVLETPGHSPGHLSLWRERDGILIMGDVLNNLNMIKMREGLQEPRKIYSIDLELNRQSARKLAQLEPRIVCFGHGKPMDGQSVVDYINGLQ